MVPPVRRRRILQASCTAGLVALAGCLGGDDSDTGNDGDDNGTDGGGDETGGDDDGTSGDDDGTSGDDSGTGGDGNGNGQGETEPRQYREYVATDDAGEATAIYADFTSLVALQEAGSGFDNLVTDSEDPLLLLPAQGLNLLLEASVTLDRLGLGELLDLGRGTLDSEVDSFLLASEAFVATGTFTPALIRQRLESDAGNFGSFEVSEERGAHTIYQPVEGGTLRVAVSAVDILVAETGTPVDRAIETVRGNRTRADEAVDEFGWVLDAVDDADVVFASQGDPPEDSAEEGPAASLSGSSSFVTTHAFGPNQVSAEAAAVFPSAEALDETTEEDLQASLGSEATDSSFEFDTDRMSVTATYSASVGGSDG